jgi:predicted dithiol-disulfide oxidoreductase (DUF899 family)
MRSLKYELANASGITSYGSRAERLRWFESNPPDVTPCLRQQGLRRYPWWGTRVCDSALTVWTVMDMTPGGRQAVKATRLE